VSQSAGQPAAAPFPLFVIKSYMGRCLNMTPPLRVPGVRALEPALSIADCDGSVRQQFGIQELGPDHRVARSAGGCI
jgi:hypothetical protein